MAGESNESFHESQNIEEHLTKYLWDSKVYYRGAPDDAREVAYQQSLMSMSELIYKVVDDPREADRIIRAVMPPRFDEKNDLDIELWEEKLQQVPVELVKQGYITIGREDVSVEFFDQLLKWSLENSTGHDVACAATNDCVHELPSREATCPVQATVKVLLNEVRLLYYKLHGEYTAYAAANRISFMQDRIEAIGDMLVRYEIGSREDIEAFLYRNEDSAIRYAAKVNGLQAIEE